MLTLAQTFDAEQIRTFVASSNLYLVPYSSTHHTRSTSSLLDLCIIDDANKLVNHEQRDICFLSAHDLIGITYNIKIERVPRRPVCVRDFQTFEVDDFLDDLDKKEWNDLYQTTNVDVKVQIFNEVLINCLNKHAPYRAIRPRHLPAPWLTREIKSLMKERDKVRRAWKRKRTDAGYAQFKHLRNMVQYRVRRAKEEYYLTEFQNVHEPNLTWKKLRHLGLLKPKTEAEKLVYTIENLNKYFTNCEGAADDLEVGAAYYLGKEI